jgi:hypothetical protein
MGNKEERQAEEWKDMKNMEEICEMIWKIKKKLWNDMENIEENSEKIWKNTEER